MYFRILMLSALALAAFAMQVQASEYQRRSTEAAFITSDTDRSGSISLKEFSSYIQKIEGSRADSAQTARKFSLMDVNQDSKLTLEELETGEEISPNSFR